MAECGVRFKRKDHATGIGEDRDHDKAWDLAIQHARDSASFEAGQWALGKGAGLPD